MYKANVTVCFSMGGGDVPLKGYLQFKFCSCRKTNHKLLNLYPYLLFNRIYDNITKNAYDISILMISTLGMTFL